jgi:hypothetical protein
MMGMIVLNSVQELETDSNSLGTEKLDLRIKLLQRSVSIHKPWAKLLAVASCGQLYNDRALVREQVNFIQAAGTNIYLPFIYLIPIYFYFGTCSQSSLQSPSRTPPPFFLPFGFPLFSLPPNLIQFTFHSLFHVFIWDVNNDAETAKPASSESHATRVTTEPLAIISFHNCSDPIDQWSLTWGTLNPRGMKIHHREYAKTSYGVHKIGKNVINSYIIYFTCRL